MPFNIDFLQKLAALPSLGSRFNVAEIKQQLRNIGSKIPAQLGRSIQETYAVQSRRFSDFHTLLTAIPLLPLPHQCFSTFLSFTIRRTVVAGHMILSCIVSQVTFYWSQYGFLNRWPVTAPHFPNSSIPHGTEPIRIFQFSSRTLPRPVSFHILMRSPLKVITLNNYTETLQTSLRDSLANHRTFFEANMTMKCDDSITKENYEIAANRNCEGQCGPVIHKTWQPWEAKKLSLWRGRLTSLWNLFHQLAIRTDPPRGQSNCRSICLGKSTSVHNSPTLKISIPLHPF